MIGKPALCACFVLGVALAAAGQSRQENLNNCEAVDTDTRIAGCTALIQAGQDTNQNMAVAYNNRGNAYDKKRDYDRAIQDFSEAIRLEPNQLYAYYNRGIDYYYKGDYDRAIQDDNEAIRLNPNFAPAYYSRGGAYGGKRDYDRAIQDYSEAIRLKPNDASSYNNRGLVYEMKGDYDRAIQDYDEAIRINPDDRSGSAYYNRGFAYSSYKGDYDRAIQDYNEAIRVNPNFAHAYEKRGDAYLFQSNLTAAIANFEEVISTAPSSNPAVYAALMLHVAAKRQGHDDARQLARVAAAADLSKWPGPVLKLDLGQVTVDEVMVAAANPSADMQKRQVYEANYFTAEDALLHHQRATALARLKAARDCCPKNDTYYAAARAELNRLDVAAAPTK